MENLRSGKEEEASDLQLQVDALPVEDTHLSCGSDPAKRPGAERAGATGNLPQSLMHSTDGLSLKTDTS